MLLTCIAILAVDFAVFPRELAKTETTGISVMDIGVGNFIVASAIASKFARGKAASGKWQYFIVLALGVGRMVVLKAINYHEHVSEYGEHWNFFVTLFAVWLFADAMHHFPVSCIAFFSLCTLLLYQYLLQRTSLQNYLFSSTRTSFIDSNKEGIFSLLGYVPLYLLTETASRYIYFSEVSERSNNKSRLMHLTVSWIVSTAIRELCVMANILPSRRIANLPYVATIMSLASLLLLVLHCIEQVFPSPLPYTLHILNNYQLQIFLIANVLTGIVNMVFPTIYMGHSEALAIIGVYAISLVSAGHVLDICYRNRKK